MRSVLFPNAPQPDVVLASRKDDSYEEHVTSAVEEAVTQLIGRRNSLRFKKEIRLLGELLYNALTTGVGLQTPGEEYCFIHKVTGDGRRPSSVRRGLFILCKVLVPYVIDRLSKREILLNLYSSHRTGDIPSTYEEPSGSLKKIKTVVASGWEVVREWFRRNSRTTQRVVDFAKRCHMVFFYLSGSYYLISHTFVGIKLFNIDGKYQRVPQYWMLGLFLLFQILVSTLLLEDDTSSVQDNGSTLSVPILESDGRPAIGLASSSTINEVQQNFASKCPLCLSPCHYATSIACGHVFCWKCIAGWVQEKGECPICRTNTTLQDLVCIYHADY